MFGPYKTATTEPGGQPEAIPPPAGVAHLERELREFLRDRLEAQSDLSPRACHDRAAEAAHAAIRHLAGATDAQLAAARRVSPRTIWRRRRFVREHLETA